MGEISSILDKLDQFGTPFSESFVPEYELIRLIESFDLTLEQASLKRKEGTLPKIIVDVWSQYDALQMAKLERHVETAST